MGHDNSPNDTWCAADEKFKPASAAVKCHTSSDAQIFFFLIIQRGIVKKERVDAHPAGTFF